MSLESGLFSIRSIAWPESTGWEQEASTSRAPAALIASATLVSVPAVSTMSSTISAVRPSTSPITWCTSATFGWSRRLSTIASGVSRRFA